MKLYPILVHFKSSMKSRADSAGELARSRFSIGNVDVIWASMKCIFVFGVVKTAVIAKAFTRAWLSDGFGKV